MPSNKKKNSKANEEIDEFFFDYEKNEKSSCKMGIICTKSIVIIYNILMILMGALLVLIGVWTLTSKQDYVSLLSASLYQSATYSLIVAGCLLILTAVLGIFSVWFESKKALTVFMVLLVVIFLVEITAGSLAFGYRAQLKSNLKNDLEIIIFNEYGQPGFAEKTRSLDDLQIKLKCCGASNFLDWKDSNYVRKANESSTDSLKTDVQFNLVAESCCKTPSKLCGKRTHPSNINYYGCVEALEKFIKNHIILLGIVGVGSCLFEVIGILLTMILLRRINQRKQYEYVKTIES